MFILRPAAASEAPAIRALVRQAQINPLDLDWPRFIVALSPEGELIGCGQVKPHRDGSRELASIVVAPAYRKQGIARAIIKELSAQEPGELYLTCRANLGPFYEKMGYRVIEEDEMPPYFRRIRHIFRVLGKAHLMGESLLVMKREPSSAGSEDAG